jgi:MFS family permease
VHGITQKGVGTQVGTVAAEPLTRRFSRSKVFWSIFLIGVGFASLAWTRLNIAILLPEVMRGIGVTSLAAGGLISTLTLLGDGVAEPFMGRLSDRVSRRFALALGVAIFSLFTLLSGFANSLGTMITFRILLGVGQAMFIPAYFAFLGGAFQKRRGFVLGALGGLFTIGSTINAPATRAIFNAAGKTWQAPFWVFGAFGLLLALGIALVGSRGIYEAGRRRAQDVTARSEAADVEAGKTGVLGRDMILLLVAMVFWGVTQYGFLGVFTLFLRTHQHFTLAQAAAIDSIGGWCSFCFSFLGGWMSDYLGRRWSLVIFGLVGVILSYPIFSGLTHTFATALVLSAVFRAANGMFFPLGVAYAQDLARLHHLGGHSGAVSGIGHLIAGFSGLIVGGIASSFGFAAVGLSFVVFSAVMVVGIYLMNDPVHAARLSQRQAAVPGTAGR